MSESNREIAERLAGKDGDDCWCVTHEHSHATIPAIDKALEDKDRIVEVAAIAIEGARDAVKEQQAEIERLKEEIGALHLAMLNDMVHWGDADKQLAQARREGLREGLEKAAGIACGTLWRNCDAAIRALLPEPEVLERHKGERVCLEDWSEAPCALSRLASAALGVGEENERLLREFTTQTIARVKAEDACEAADFHLAEADEVIRLVAKESSYFKGSKLGILPSLPEHIKGIAERAQASEQEVERLKVRCQEAIDRGLARIEEAEGTARARLLVASELSAKLRAVESRERSLREALEKARERLRHCDRGHDDRFIDAALFLSPAPQQEGADRG